MDGKVLMVDESLAWARLFKLLPELMVKAQEVLDETGMVNNAWALSAVADQVVALQDQVRALNEKVEILTITNAGLVRFAQTLMKEETQADGANGNDQG